MMEVNTPVDVISLFSADGEITPLRLQIKQPNHQLLRMNVDQIVGSRTIPHVGAEAQIFTCIATVFERQMKFELKYAIRSHDWTICRIIYS